MRLALGVVALAWLCPAAAHAGADDTSSTATPSPLEARIARLEAQLAEVQATTDAALTAASAGDDKEPAIRVYGFIDMGLQKVWTADDPVIPTTKTTFVLGNINLYFDFHPAPDWSSLVEVRLTNYPAGAEQNGIPLAGIPYSRVSTEVRDPSNGEGYNVVRWGALVLERAYIQWQRQPVLGLRVGQFLTPYGIWNVDHGTPTLISLYRPKAQSNQMFPERQLGVELFGRFDQLPWSRWQLAYNAYVSNGRTPGTVSLTNSKMVGGRVVLSTTRPWKLAVGASGMVGRYVDQQHNINVVTGEIERPATVKYDEYGVGVDASLDLGPLRLRAEAALRHKTYGTEERDLWAPGIELADGYESDIYALAAYRIPHTRFEPYVYSEYYHWPTPIGDRELLTSVGINTYFTPGIQLKLQLTQQTWYGGGAVFGKADPDLTFLASKLVMGF